VSSTFHFPQQQANLARSGRGGRWLPHQAGVLGEYAIFQQSQVWPGFDTKLFTEQRARLTESAEGFGLSSGPVEGQHQLTPDPLAQWVDGHQLLQFGDQIAVLSHRQLGRYPVFDRSDTKLLEADGDRTSEVLFRESIKRLTPEEPVGFAEFGSCQPGSVFLQRPAALTDQSLADLEVKFIRFEPDQIAWWTGDDDALSKRRTQPGYVDLQRRG
jgi:hypothetical protein